MDTTNGATSAEKTGGKVGSHGKEATPNANVQVTDSHLCDVTLVHNSSEMSAAKTGYGSTGHGTYEAGGPKQEIYSNGQLIGSHHRGVVEALVQEIGQLHAATWHVEELCWPPAILKAVVRAELQRQILVNVLDAKLRPLVAEHAKSGLAR